MSMIGDASVATSGQTAPSVTFTNLNISYRMPALSGTLDLFLNVENLFNTVPPPANFYGTASNTGQFGGFAVGDDPIERYYTAGARYRL
jgi:outer membrane receptor protein involved in Fe transport